MYRLRFLDQAERDFERLDKSVSVRILRKLTWLAVDAEHTAKQGLLGDMVGLSKLCEGDFRIIYELLHEEHTIVVHSVGHRSGVYKR